MALQRKGIDCVITLHSGRKLFVDEKMRRRLYDDILLEYEHAYKFRNRHAPGWMEKQLTIDYLAYGMKPKTAYVFPWQSLRRAWLDNKEWWFKMFSPVAANNRDYVTYSLPIPTNDLIKAVSGAMTVYL